MSARALIISIEHYPEAAALASRIDGATVSAEQFFVWLTSVKQVQSPNIYVAASGGTCAGANLFATQRERIVDAIAALVAAGKDQTEELYVFFSGHGYGF